MRSAEDIHEVISSLSDIVWNVNPEYDDLKFLMARMRRYALDILDNTEILYRVDISEPDGRVVMNMEQRRDLFMAFKEGLNNLVKYSGAKQAEIMIRLEDRTVQMKIKDDGRGFDPDQVEYGNGLKNMKQRTDNWSGVFTLTTAVGRGTELNFIFPIKK
jgi:signal transduction histidine kinase